MTSTLSVADRRRAALERSQALTGRPPSTPRAVRRTVTARAPRTTKVRAATGAAPRSGLFGLIGLGVRDPEAVREKKLAPPPGTYYVIAAIVLGFVMFGLVMVLSSSAYVQAAAGKSPYTVFNRQLMWAGLGLVGMFVAARTPYTFWKKCAIPLTIVGVASMVAPFIPGLNDTVNGTHSWVRIAGLSIQPSEFLKLVVVIAAADLLTRRADELADNRRTALPVACLAAVSASMSLAQGDLGSAIVLGAIVLSVAWIAGMPTVPLGAIVLGGLLLAGIFIATSARRLSRFTAFLDIDGHKDIESYQVYQSLVSMANGGLSGSGIGGSRGKLGYLPLAHSDFIFAIIADELGMIGTVAVIGGFLVLVAFGIQTAMAAPDRFGMLLAGGVSTWFGVQVIINLGGVAGVMPMTGLTLPFFSAGGSSLFVSMFAAGLLLSVARRAVRE